jgi:hypothetical protein
MSTTNYSAAKNDAISLHSIIFHVYPESHRCLITDNFTPGFNPILVSRLTSIWMLRLLPGFPNGMHGYGNNQPCGKYAYDTQ